MSREDEHDRRQGEDLLASDWFQELECAMVRLDLKAAEEAMERLFGLGWKVHHEAMKRIIAVRASYFQIADKRPIVRIWGFAPLAGLTIKDFCERVNGGNAAAAGTVRRAGTGVGSGRRRSLDQGEGAEPMKPGSRDAWIVARLLCGRLQVPRARWSRSTNRSGPALADRLRATVLDRRMFVWDGFLAARPDPNAWIDAIGNAF